MDQLRQAVSMRKMTTQVLIRMVAILAAMSVAGTLWFIAAFGTSGGLRPLAASGPLGLLTIVGWVLTLVAGPIAAVQLWRFRQSGRRAGIVLFGYGLAYYVVGLLVLQQPEASTLQILVAATAFALPLVVLLMPGTREVFAARSSKDG